MTEENKTTVEIYNKFQVAVDLIEKKFFLDKGKYKFPKVVMAINTNCKYCVTAFVSPEELYDIKKNEKLQYLAINPKYLNRDIGSILATLCHELCHVYENAYIHIPRGGYHDKQWSELITDCGLEAIFLNKSKTSVSTKIKEGEIFEEFVKDFTDSFGEDHFNIVAYSPEIEHKTKVKLGLIDSDSTSDEDDGIPKADNANKKIKKYNRNKVKYVCTGCGAKVWGKDGLHIHCSDCDCVFEKVWGKELIEDNL